MFNLNATWVCFLILVSVKTGTPRNGNDELYGYLEQVEREALAQGLAPEAVSIMLEFAMSLRMSKYLVSYEDSSLYY